MKQFIELHSSVTDLTVLVNVNCIAREFERSCPSRDDSLKMCTEIEFNFSDSEGLSYDIVKESYFEVCEKIRCALRD